MRVIPLIEFVLAEIGIGTFKYNEIQIRKYADFLQQPLTIGMFVPCDENNTPIPNPYEYDRNNIDEWEDEYEQAKEKVLFEGWDKRIKDIDTFKVHLKTFKNIEEIINWDLKLTPSAIKL